MLICQVNIQRDNHCERTILQQGIAEETPGSKQGKAKNKTGFRATASGAEVDAILETPGELIPIEIKWTDSPSRADARHVETFMDLNEKKSKRGYVICRAPRKQKLTDRTTVLPWDIF